MARVRVAVAVEDDALGHVEAIVRACRAVGFCLDSELPVVGVFTGSIAAHRLDSLREIPGVAAVEIQRGFRSTPGPHRPH
jgi:hypothetical protein